MLVLSFCSVTLWVMMLLLKMALGFKTCPIHCQCYDSSDLVDCRSRGLGRVPVGVPRGTWLLDLNGNKLPEVRAGSFMGLWSLKILLMSNNSIRTLQPQSLSSLRFLERLDLASNRLRWLPPYFSQSLSSLQDLRLDHNLLQHLHPSSLAGAQNLRRLDLSYNHLRSLDVRVFSSLSLLSLLSLEGNLLNVLQDGLLSRQQRLEVLLLNHNNISVIQTQALASLPSLTLLGLQGNQLQHIRFKTFLMLQTSSVHLQLSSNPWICDCELQRAFNKLHRVRRLRVHDYRSITCHAPARHRGSALTSLDSQLCVAETASTLVITVTVTLAVIGALVKAEQNRKNKKSMSDAESERQDQDRFIRKEEEGKSTE